MIGLSVRRLIRLAVVMAGLAVVALALAATAHAQDDVLKVRVEIGDGGFACSSTGPGAPACQNTEFGHDANFTITVPQGQLVELTFAWAHVGYLTEEHLMALNAYKLEWDKLDFYSREATVKFVATEPGSFEFKCELECELHDFVEGHLVVKRGGGGQEITFTPTNLSVVPSSWVTAGDPVSLMVTLRDPDNAPVSKAELAFYQEAEFGGTKDSMLLGTAKTDANGVAFFDFKPTLEESKTNLTVRFEGMGIYDESEVALQIEEIAAPPPAYKKAPTGLGAVSAWGPRGLAIAMAAVWSVMAFVAYQAVSVAWVNRRQ